MPKRNALDAATAALQLAQLELLPPTQADAPDSDDLHLLELDDTEAIAADDPQLHRLVRCLQWMVASQTPLQMSEGNRDELLAAVRHTCTHRSPLLPHARHPALCGVIRDGWGPVSGAVWASLLRHWWLTEARPGMASPEARAIADDIAAVWREVDRYRPDPATLRTSWRLMRPFWAANRAAVRGWPASLRDECRTWVEENQ